MNLKKIILIAAILILLPISFRLFAGDFGQSQSLFTDIKAHRIGDILTVNIYENARASNQAETKAEKSGKASTKGGPGIGPLDFIPLFGAEFENKSNFDGKGENLRNQSLRARISVTVVDIRENGDLIIKGTRSIGIGPDKESITLTGVVRTKDIKPDNTIDSYLIAEAEISYTGKGAANTGSRPGLFTRIVNWLF
jgi:flagellar L-ring protein precursor FlgH